MKTISKITERLRPLLRKLRIDREDKAGVYLTVIFHLVLVIILLSWSIHVQLTKDTSFLIDFSAQEEQEQKAAKEKMKESVSAELDELLNQAGRQNRSNIRNVAVDASEPLKDDRYEHPEDIYKDARELQERLNRSRKEVEDAADSKDNVSVSKKGGDKSSKAKYNGPSVISYSLDGRKAMSLPVPAYKCLGGGDVSVSIIVNRKGYVVGTKIIESVSSADQCLRDYALRAAARSRFTASQNAPERQAGEIVYRFIAQ